MKGAQVLTAQIKKLMNSDATITKKSEVLKDKKRAATIEYAKEINSCKNKIMDSHALKDTLMEEKKKLFGEKMRRMLAHRNLRILQKLVKTQTAAGNKSKIDRKALSIVVTKMMAAEGTLLECGSTIKANTEIVRERLENGRTHVNGESSCEAWKTKTQKVINAKMGDYKGTIEKLKALQKSVRAKSDELKKANNKNSENVFKQAMLLDGYIHDTAYKSWTLTYQDSIVRGWQCSIQ